jgi:hypothetical protein
MSRGPHAVLVSNGPRPEAPVGRVPQAPEGGISWALGPAHDWNRILDTSDAGDLDGWTDGPPFEALLLPHLSALYRLAMRMTGDPISRTQARRWETRVQIPAPQSNDPPTRLKPRRPAGEASSRRALAAETA